MFQWNEIEQAASEADLLLFQDNRDEPVWSYDENSPHLSAFRYLARTYVGDSDSLYDIAKVTGYRLSHDWRISEEDAWRGADSLDSDIVSYVDALIREMGCCRRTGLGDPELSSAKHVSFIGHVNPCSEQKTGQVWEGVVASLLLKDTPDFLVVDPREFSRTGGAAERLTTRARIAILKKLGLVRMVSAPLLWGWNIELAEGFMATYNYEVLLQAKRSGELAGVFDEVVSRRIYGPLSSEHLTRFRLPLPEEPID